MSQDARVALIQQAKNGDHEAFVELVVDHEQWIRTIIRNVVPDMPGYHADTLFQESLRVAFQDFVRLPISELARLCNGEDAFEMWLDRTVKETCEFIRFKIRFRKEDEKAFQPYEKFVRILIREKFQRLLQEDQDEIVQDVKWLAYRTLPEFRGSEKTFKAWLRITTRGLCLNALRKQPPTDALTDTLVASQRPDEDFVRAERRKCVQDALRLLPDEHREVMVWNLEGLRYKEIAKMLDIPIGTVQSRLNRARIQLKKQLEALHCVDMFA